MGNVQDIPGKGIRNRFGHLFGSARWTHHRLYWTLRHDRCSGEIINKPNQSISKSQISRFSFSQRWDCGKSQPIWGHAISLAALLNCNSHKARDDILGLCSGCIMSPITDWLKVIGLLMFLLVTSIFNISLDLHLLRRIILCEYCTFILLWCKGPPNQNYKPVTQLDGMHSFNSWVNGGSSLQALTHFYVMKSYHWKIRKYPITRINTFVVKKKTTRRCTPFWWRIQIWFTLKVSRLLFLLSRNTNEFTQKLKHYIL